MKRISKLLSIILSIAMIMSFMPVIASAAETESKDIFANTGALDTGVITWTSTNFTFKNEQNTSTNAIRTSDTNHFRMYAGSKTTITALNGKSIAQVVITATTADYATALVGNCTYSDGTAVAEGSIVTINFATPVSSFSIDISKQVRLNKVEVTFANAGGAPICQHTNSTYIQDGMKGHKQDCQDCDYVSAVKAHTFSDKVCTACGYNLYKPAHLDKVTIYYPNGDTYVSGEPNGAKLADGEGIELVVKVDSNGYYSFVTSEGKYLTSGETGSSLSFTTTASEYSLWALEEAPSGWYLKNVNAVYGSGDSAKPQYLEYYNGFTTYSLNSGGAIYTFMFVKTGTATSIPVFTCTHSSVVDYVCQSCHNAVEPAADSTLSIPNANKLGVAVSGYSVNKYYVKGTVKSIASDVYGNLYIVDENGNELYVYGVYSADGTTRYDAMENAPKVGDTVTLYGIIGNHNGAPQMKSGWMTSYTAHTCDNTGATCTQPGHCSKCGAEGTSLGHNWSTTASKNATHHWYECLNSGCTEKKDYNAHNNTGATCIAAGSCSVCGAAGTTVAHNHSTEWSTDGQNHWHECTTPGCTDKADLEAHVYEGATCSKAGVCECGKVGTTDPNTHTKAEGSNVCVGCGKSLCVTCTDAAGDGDHNCDACGAANASAHTTVPTPAKNPTCTEAGNNLYHTCTECNGVFKDANGTTSTTVNNEKLPATGHSLTEVPAVTPTTEKEGNIKHWVCSGCGKLFADAEGTLETTKAAVTLEKLPPIEPDGPAAGDGYTKVTSLADITAGGKFVIVAEYDGKYYVLTTTVGDNGKIAAMEITLDGNTISGDDLPVWTIAAMSDGISLNNGTGYLKYKTGTNMEATTSAYKWIVQTGTNNGTFKLIPIDAETRGLSFRMNKGEPMFGAYALSNENNDYSAEYTMNLMIFKAGTTSGGNQGGNQGGTTTPPSDDNQGGSTTPPTGGNQGGSTTPPTGGNQGGTTTPPTGGNQGGTTTPPTGGNQGGTTNPPATEPKPTPAPVTDYYGTLLNELKDGDQVIIYSVANGSVMTPYEYLYEGKTTKVELEELAASLKGQVLTYKYGAVVLTVHKDGDIVSFTAPDGTYLYADGTDVKFVEEAGEFTKFVLEAAEGGYYIRCATANFNGKPQYLEIYSGYFTCYGMGEDTSIYTFQFYAADPETPAATGDNVISVAIAALLVSAMGTMVLFSKKKHF